MEGLLALPDSSSFFAMINLVIKILFPSQLPQCKHTFKARKGYLGYLRGKLSTAACLSSPELWQL